MMKTYLLTLSCCFSLVCFSQPTIKTDTVVKTAFLPLIVKGTSAQVGVKPSFKIYPNPAKNKVSLQVTGFVTGIATVKIIDTKGKIVREDKRLLTDGTDEINMFLQLSPGIYFISINEKNKVVKKKLVVL